MKVILIILILFFSSACIDNPGTENNRPEDRFISAEGKISQEEYGNYSENNGSSGTNGGAEREAEEGDIYRVFDGGLLLNLNATRGLQIIDFSDPSSPEIIGHLKIIGTPKEMYKVGNFVYILLNDWWGYNLGTSPNQTQPYFGGIVISVDISNHQYPKLVSQSRVPGAIGASRLTRDTSGEVNKESLYVVSSSWGDRSSYVSSFSINLEDGTLNPVAELPLAGDVRSVQATGDRLIVSRSAHQEDAPILLSLIDISSPDGAMFQSEPIPIKGISAKKSDMSIYKSILRVVSHSSDNKNHIQTFDVSDLSNPQPIDHQSFGDGQSLFATLFIENTAFFVTYFQQDPFHTFSFTDQGMIKEESEFVVSGFNTWFRAVNDNKALIGIGINDEGGRRSPAVSLYDIEDLANPNPLLDRDEIPLDWSWSEADWDDRAFSVLEKVVNVAGPNGEIETGLILLPFVGSNDDESIAGVQIFSFSESSVTKRGLLDHTGPVRRTFLADSIKDLVANISENELSLHDSANIDTPRTLSTLPLSPIYSELFSFGGFLARREVFTPNWQWGYRQEEGLFSDTVQIIGKESDPETQDIVAEFTIPSNAILLQAGDLFVVIENMKGEKEYEIAVQVWDLSNPLLPQRADSLLTPLIKGGRSFYQGQNIHIVANAVVFSDNDPQWEKIGTRHLTYRFVDEDLSACYRQNELQACSFLTGAQTCSYIERLDGSITEETCFEDFYRCDQNDKGEPSCEAIAMPPEKLVTINDQEEVSRVRNHNTFYVLDISDPQNIHLQDPILTAEDEDATSVLVQGNTLHFGFKKALPLPDNGQALARYYFRTYDFSNPGAPILSPDINIPGELITKRGDDIITQEYRWVNQRIQASIARLSVNGEVATLVERRDLHERTVLDARFVPPNKILVHQFTFSPFSRSRSSYLTVIDADTFEELSDSQLNIPARLNQALSGSALFDVRGGVLLMDIDRATPTIRSFFPLQGWRAHVLVVGEDMFVSAGVYGIYSFDLNRQNILAP